MRKNLSHLLVGAVAASASLAASAGGFMLTEQSVTGLGRAYAGMGIVGDDLSAVWYNPAGMTLLSGTQMQIGAVLAGLDLPFTTASGAHDNGRDREIPIPNFYLVHQMNDRMWFGLGITVPFGMATEYDRHWELAYKGMNAEVVTFDINPSVAWKINDQLSLGVGMSAQYVRAHFESATEDSGIYGRLSAGGWAWGANIGLMWTPVDNFRVGLSYRSQVNHHATGTYRMGQDAYAALTGETYYLGHGTGRASMSGPQWAALTATWQIVDPLRLSATIRWAGWSSFKDLPISWNLTGGFLHDYAGMTHGSSDPEYDWDDSWLYSVGLDYRVNNALTLRVGVAYEDSPVTDKLRTATIPDADRVWFTIGATWRVTEKLQGDFGLAYLKGVGNKELYNGQGVEVGEFDRLDAILCGAQLVYRFK